MTEAHTLRQHRVVDELRECRRCTRRSRRRRSSPSRAARHRRVPAPIVTAISQKSGAGSRPSSSTTWTVSSSSSSSAIQARSAWSSCEVRRTTSARTRSSSITSAWTACPISNSACERVGGDVSGRSAARPPPGPRRVSARTLGSHAVGVLRVACASQRHRRRRLLRAARCPASSARLVGHRLGGPEEIARRS